MRRAWVGLAVVVGELACATGPPATPGAAPGSVQETVRRIEASCSRGSCRSRFAVGSTEMLIEMRARAMSPSDAKGDSATFTDVMKELAEELLSFTRAGSLVHEVGIGSARLQLADSSMVWRCGVAWIEGVEQKGWFEEDRFRVREGVDCTAYSLPDSVAQWRMRRGIAVTPREVARIADRLGTARPRPNEMETLPVRLERLGGRAHPDSLLYNMTYLRREGSRRSAHILVWGVTRQDGTPMATYFQGDGRPSTLEFAPGAAQSERQAVRAVVALLRLPLRATD